MVKNNADLRSVRTNKLIRRTFEKMLMETHRPVKVSALTKRAGINRKTFYLHYDTMDDLVDTYIADVRADILHRLTKHSVNDYFSQPGLLIHVLMNFFQQNTKFYTYFLLQDDGSFPRARRLQTDMTKYLARRVAKARNISIDDATLIITFSTSTILTMLRLKVDGQSNLSIDEMADKITALSVDGLRGAMNIHFD